MKKLNVLYASGLLILSIGLKAQSQQDLQEVRDAGNLVTTLANETANVANANPNPASQAIGVALRKVGLDAQAEINVVCADGVCTPEEKNYFYRKLAEIQQRYNELVQKLK